VNPVLILTRNNLELTKRCIESVLRQDIGEIRLNVYDNASTDGTFQWLKDQHIAAMAYPTNAGVSRGWNQGIDHLMFWGGRVLVIGNDTVLPAWFYRTLLRADAPFVTGVAVDKMEQIQHPEPSQLFFDNHPDFSAFLIRREAWEAIGLFDENMKLYSSDQDYHIRGHRKGVRMVKANVPFYHERSSTLRLASPEEAQAIQTQANMDRAELRRKWGVPAGGPEYEALFTPETFGCETVTK
jgi:GT2 family glycosyltransferase